MASSPASSRGASPEILDPEAKVRGLLAQLDSSDDEAATNPTKKQPYKAGLPKARLHSASSDNESDVDIRPRGRLAARMQGKKTSSPIPESSLPETARERLRKSLMAGKDDKMEAAKSAAPAATAHDDEEDEDDDDDDELPVARHRIARRNATTESAEVNSINRADSPGLFVSSPPKPSPSKAQSVNGQQNEESEDEDLPAIKSDRFKALVEKKRQERLAREAAEQAKETKRRARLEQLADDDDNESSITDDEGGRQLTQKERPTRKAGKKAVEEMNRETQRMQRNQQLAHEAKTRKKISKSSLFERFKYRPGGEPLSVANSSSQPEPDTPQTDATMKDVDTSPSSPPTAQKTDGKVHMMINQTPEEAVNVGHGDGDLPSVDELALETPRTRTDKGKAKEEPSATLPAAKGKRQIRVRLPNPSAHVVSLADSDDELQVTYTARDKVKAAFDNVPLKKQQESHSLQALRALAGVRSPGKENGRCNQQPGITSNELQASLREKARRQARLERDRRLEILKARGVVIQTAEDKEREMREVENILAKAREEDQKLMKQERAEAKKEARENGTADPLAWDDSEDEEYVGSANEGEDGADDGDDESAIGFSGSEDEETAAAADEDEDAMVDDEAEDEAEDEETTEPAQTVTASANSDNEHNEQQPSMSSNRRRGRNLAAILSDDEDVIEATPKPMKQKHMSPGAPANDSPVAPTSVLRSAKKTFIPGLPVEGPAGLGLTQIFAGTMDDSQQMTPGRVPTQSMMPDFDNFPDSNFSAKSDTKTKDSHAEDTQGSTQGVKFNISQSQMRKLDTLLQQNETQTSGQFEPSQDVGFAEYTPMLDRFVEPPTSTVQTVVLDKPEQRSQGDSPLVSRGRLRRKLDVIPETADADAESAFGAMRAGAEKEQRRKMREEFNKKKSKAKEMVEEQADESEDEYAGLGGADGEDSDDGSVASVKGMIDDENADELDESKIAAFYAERERAKNEQDVERLYKDITTGALRRKRGADYDLSDSDDGGAALRRQKQRKFKQQQKALFADERVKKMAENPGNQAFLKTIQDQGSDDEMDLLMIDDPENSQGQQTSQATPPPQAPPQDGTAEDAQTVPDSQPRKVLGSQGAAGGNRAPANPRRTRDGRKPANIGEVRETLSNLLEGREASVIPATQSMSDSEEEGDGGADEGSSSFRSDKENQPHPRRGRSAVVDRISLKRHSSSSVSQSSRLAFAAGAPAASAFKIPSFLRRSSTTASLSSDASGAATQPAAAAAGAAGFGEDAKVKKTAGKRSGVGAFSSGGAAGGKKNEVRALMEEKERRRQERRMKGAERRVGAVGGLLGRGTFE